MNLGAVNDVRREMESLQTQVENIQIDLQKAKEECVIVTSKAEQKHTEQVAVNLKLKKQVEGLQSDLAASRNSQLDA